LLIQFKEIWGLEKKKKSGQLPGPHWKGILARCGSVAVHARMANYCSRGGERFSQTPNLGSWELAAGKFR